MFAIASIVLVSLSIIAVVLFSIVLLIFSGLVYEDFREFPVAVLTVGAVIAALLYTLWDKTISPQKWLLWLVHDFWYRSLTTMHSMVWVIIGAWWLYRGFSSHHYAIFYTFSGVLMLIWQVPLLITLLLLNAKYFQQLTIELLKSPANVPVTHH
jgi:hypothetical protein